jgi:hypothetical protein
MWEECATIIFLTKRSFEIRILWFITSYFEERKKNNKEIKEKKRKERKRKEKKKRKERKRKEKKKRKERKEKKRKKRNKREKKVKIIDSQVVLKFG